MVIFGEADEAEQSFEQAARQPLHLLRRGIGRIRRRILEAPRISLRADDTAIEINVVARRVVGELGMQQELDLGRHVDRDGGVVVERQVLGRAIGRHDPVAVAAAGLRGVVGPLERLHRMVGRADRRSRGQSAILLAEALYAAHPVALVDLPVLELRAFDPEAHQAVSLLLLSGLEIPRQDDDISPRNGPCAQHRAGTVLPHRTPPMTTV
jgi:hypothetical protein